jgi:hypothetical protein
MRGALPAPDAEPRRNRPGASVRTAPVEGTPTEEEKAALARAKHFFDQLSGYSNIQKTRPQTIGYALTDSPVAQAAWI